jgi:hypothetical protein
VLPRKPQDLTAFEDETAVGLDRLLRLTGGGSMSGPALAVAYLKSLSLSLSLSLPLFLRSLSPAFGSNGFLAIRRP